MTIAVPDDKPGEPNKHLCTVLLSHHFPGSPCMLHTQAFADFSPSIFSRRQHTRIMILCECAPSERNDDKTMPLDIHFVILHTCISYSKKQASTVISLCTPSRQYHQTPIVHMSTRQVPAALVESLSSTTCTINYHGRTRTEASVVDTHTTLS